MNLKARTKFRFAEFAHLAKQQIFEDVPLSDSLIDSDFCSASTQHIAVILNSTNAGLAAILDRQRPFRFNATTPRLIGHKRPISDVQFNPFDESILMTASDDGFVGIWRVQTESDIREPLAMFQASMKKISSVQFSPVVENLALIASWDGKIALYDISTLKPVREIAFSKGSEEPEIPASATFDWTGQKIYAVAKDSKVIRVFSSADGALITEFPAKTTGVKPPRLITCGSTGCLCVSGANRNQERVFYFLNDEHQQIGDTLYFQQSSSLFLTFWDENAKLVHAVSRGSTEYAAFEFENGRFDQVLQMPCEFPIKGACLVPTRAVNTQVTEVAILVVLNSKGYVQPMSLRVPSKTVGFNKKFYGTYFAGKPALSMQEFLEGATAAPLEAPWGENGEATGCTAANFQIVPQEAVPNDSERPREQTPSEPVAEKAPTPEAAEKTELQLLREEVETLKQRVAALESRARE